MQQERSLSRQARDKHLENLLQKGPFSYSGLTPTAAAWEVGSGAGAAAAAAAAAAAGAKTVLCCLLFSALSNTDNREVRLFPLNLQEESRVRRRHLPLEWIYFTQHLPLEWI